MDSNSTQAERFRALHAERHLLILANVWDAASARLVASCGAPALATTSAGVAWARGYPDGNALPRPVVRAAVAEIARATDLPLSVDSEAGYSSDPAAVADLVSEIVQAGACGINIEDGTSPPDLLAAKLQAIRQAAPAARLFINVRIDVYLKKLADPERRVEETVARARRYLAAGGDGIFVPGVTAADEIRALVAAVAPAPLNVMAFPGLPGAAELRAMGVRRLSAGATIAVAAFARARAAATAFLAEGSSDFGDEKLDLREVNR